MFNFTIDKTSSPAISYDKIYDFIVLGGGPAGLNAALYAKRKGLETLIITDEIGGQLNNTADVDNYLGFKMIDASELIEHFKSHVGTQDIPILSSVKVKSIKKINTLFEMTLSNFETIKSKTVLYALGGSPRKLQIPGEDEFASKGISYCVTCDGPFYKNKHVIVAGGGNSAVDAALDLAKTAKTVTLIQRSVLRADEQSVKILTALPNVTILIQTDIVSFEGDNSLKTVNVFDKLKKESKQIDIDGVFIEIGNIPNSFLAKDLVSLNEQKEIIVNDLLETSTKGLYAAGDVTSMPYKQIIISVSHGAIAALSAANYINKGDL